MPFSQPLLDQAQQVSIVGHHPDFALLAVVRRIAHIYSQRKLAIGQEASNLTNDVQLAQL